MSIEARKQVVVVGVGVCGLTSALRLASAGFDVRLVAAEPSTRTTSAVAGAIWGPYLADDKRVAPWSARTQQELTLHAKHPESGVTLVNGIEAATEPAEAPGWMLGMPGFEHCELDSLPGGYVTGWRFTVPVIDMPVYLAYLTALLRDHDVRAEILPERLRSLDDLTTGGRIVVNCTGLGARELVPDPSVYPIWGQLVVTENPGFEGFFADHGESPEPTYFMSQGDRVVMGGIIDHTGTWPHPQPDITARIVARCVAIEPKLRNAAIREERVGLRPARPSVRLERVATADGFLIHNYGHGGSGVTLAWGCADDVVALAQGARAV